VATGADVDVQVLFFQGRTRLERRAATASDSDFVVLRVYARFHESDASIISAATVKKQIV